MKYDSELIQFITLFEKLTNTHVKDCFNTRNRLVFVINAVEVSKAIGKRGVNIKKFEDATKKRIKIVSYSDDPVKFVESFIAPIKAKKIELENNVITISINGITEKGLLIGRERQNINYLKDIVKRYYNIEDVRIL